MRTIHLLFILFGLQSLACAEPVAVAYGEKAIVTLTDEPCGVPMVKNLPHRVIWAESGSTFEGCYSIAGGQLVVMYFDDRTVALLSTSVFRAVKKT